MKKLISCALILAALGSLGTMCFASNDIDPDIIPTNFERITPDYEITKEWPYEAERQEYVDAYRYKCDYEKAAQLCQDFVDLKDELKENLTEYRKTFNEGFVNAPYPAKYEPYKEAKAELGETCTRVGELSSTLYDLSFGADNNCHKDPVGLREDLKAPQSNFWQFSGGTISTIKGLNERMKKEGVDSGIKYLYQLPDLDDEKFNAFLKVTDGVFNEMEEYSKTFIRKAEDLSDKAYDFHFTEPFTGTYRCNAPAIGDNVLTDILREESLEGGGVRFVRDLSIIYNLAELQGTLEYGQAQELLNCDLGALE